MVSFTAAEHERQLHGRRSQYHYTVMQRAKYALNSGLKAERDIDITCGCCIRWN